jgi:hypothetical protein
MISVNQQRRKFLTALSSAIPPVILAAARLHAQDPASGPINEPEPKPGDAKFPSTAGSSKSALEENEKSLKKKVGKLLQLASELKDEVDKTDSVKVLSFAMLKKADEIEKLAKDIKTRAKG